MEDRARDPGRARSTGCTAVSRLFTERIGQQPGRVLNLLNRYVHLALTHSVYDGSACGSTRGG
jgi:hypothetical protein